MMLKTPALCLFNLFIFALIILTSVAQDSLLLDPLRPDTQPPIPLLMEPLPPHDSLSDEAIFNTAIFDQAVNAGKSTEEQNKLLYQPGGIFVSEAAGSLSSGNKTGSDGRFFGKAFLKVTKGSTGSLYLGYNFNYFLYASANNRFFQTLYQMQSPDPNSIAATLSEFHFSFDIKKHLFIRIGNQLISWGATYFWSPEDFINLQKTQAAVLSVVDVRTGKPGMRIHLPLPKVNLFLFTDLSAVTRKNVVGSLQEDAAQAWRIDGVIGGFQLGTVGYVTRHKAANVGVDATGNWRGTDIYSELALTFNRVGNTGTHYAYSLGASRQFGTEKEWTGRAEVYYNERGFSDTAISKLSPGAFTPFYSGKYYGYAELSTTKLCTPVLGFSIFGCVNGADRSYSLTTLFSFDIPGVLPFSLYGRYFGGRQDREFTTVYGGSTLQAGVRVRVEF
ncbi:MAG: hypothetical protein JW795_10835 [Chitinivibrionales bacterium]|nr:hypothetical protein [Chitinivibrionales bacterium]